MTTAAKRLPRESRPADVRGSGAGFDVEKVRRDFPILRRRIRGRALVYLDNAATSQKPQVVIDAMRRYYERDNANIHRGVHFLSEHATEEFEGARRKKEKKPRMITTSCMFAIIVATPNFHSKRNQR